MYAYPNEFDIFDYYFKSLIVIYKIILPSISEHCRSICGQEPFLALKTVNVLTKNTIGNKGLFLQNSRG